MKKKSRLLLSNLFVVCLSAWAMAACEAQETGAMVIREDVDDPYFASVLFAGNGMTIDQSTVRRVLRDEFETVVWLDALYEGLPVFYSEQGYSFDRYRKMAMKPGTDEPLVLGEPLPPASAFPTDLEPTVTQAEAIAAWVESIAREPVPGITVSKPGRQVVTLGIFDINVGTTHPADFKLVWRVQGPNGAPMAMVDAKSGDVLYYDSGIRTALPVSEPTEPAPGEDSQAATFDPVGTWVGGRCSDRDYRREIRFDADYSFSAIDWVAPCPRGKACIWSGIVNRSGTWELYREHDISLEPTSRETRQGKPLATNLHYDVHSGTLHEATPGSVLDCIYERVSEPARP